MSAIDKGQQWWEEASQRDQLAVVICGFIFVVYVVFMVVLNPLYNTQEKQTRILSTSTQALAKAQSLAAQIKSTQSSGGRSQGIVQIVNQSLKEFDLRLSNMQPNGNDVRLRIDQVPFDKVLPWVNNLEISKGLQVRDLDISADNEQGYVSVTLRLHQDSK